MSSGWIILDKSSGVFSRTAGAHVARMFGEKKFGHIGTLDPMATGILPVALGDATKMIPFVQEANDGEKEYLFSVQFGFETDTLDITGREIARNNIIPSDNQIQAAIPGLVGDIIQIPPQYSAIHVQGQRAYRAARDGIEIEMPGRHVHIFDIKYNGFNGTSWKFSVRCSTGTYVRSLARDIAKKCGAIASVDTIRRTYTNGFNIKNAVTLDFLEKLYNNGADIGRFLMPIDLGLGDIPVLNLGVIDAELYKHGGFIQVAMSDTMVRVYNDSKFVGIGVVKDKQLRPKRTI